MNGLADWAWREALREVDDLTPGSPRLSTHWDPQPGPVPPPVLPPPMSATEAKANYARSVVAPIL